eukprot:TRINITY_DN2465_c0_g1_i2.p1 TRINITY_DN2465_c0_g1~~TRINITY_DN2465_c0_g1_i2.p1  ORF type:complete len:213 (-),score=53.64 TRINITY_DN2465_c0_g1_i2:31-636(-)
MSDSTSVQDNIAEDQKSTEADKLRELKEGLDQLAEQREKESQNDRDQWDGTSTLIKRRPKESNLEQTLEPPLGNSKSSTPAHHAFTTHQENEDTPPKVDEEKDDKGEVGNTIEPETSQSRIKDGGIVDDETEEQENRESTSNRDETALENEVDHDDQGENNSDKVTIQIGHGKKRKYEIVQSPDPLSDLSPKKISSDVNQQ